MHMQCHFTELQSVAIVTPTGAYKVGCDSEILLGGKDCCWQIVHVVGRDAAVHYCLPG